MADDNTTGKRPAGRLNLRVSVDEYERFQRVKEAIQRRIGPNLKATDKGVFLEALACLETRYAKLEKDRSRER